MKVISLFSILLFGACAPVSNIPNVGGDNPNIIGESVSIAYLKTLYKGAPVKITKELRIAGNVVSSDVNGSFYKTLVLDDGTSGIEIKLNMEQIFKHFMIHTRVDVRCSGLWLGSYGGTLQLGAEPYESWQTQYIPESDIPLHCLTDTSFNDEVVPRKLIFEQMAAQYISTFVSFENVQFIDEEVGMSWAETGGGNGNGIETDINNGTDRHLVDTSGDTLIVRTSRHVSFAHKNLPDGSGHIEGILNYFNGKYQLIVCDDQKAVMRSERWRPVGFRYL